jgi:diguanylate cyclase (GGDEF)-like protein
MPPAAIRLLLIEDNPLDAEMEVRELKRAGLRIEHRRADNEPDCRAALAHFRPEVIISDFAMPNYDGMSALALAQELCPRVPFIFVSGTLGEDYAIRALKNGATDYVLKTNLVRLPPAVERALADAEQRRRLERLSRMRQFSSHINWALVRIREREELFSAMTRIAVDVGGLRAARVGVLDPASGDLGWRPWYGTWEGAPPPVLRSSARNDETGSGLAGRALREMAPIVVNDVAEDRQMRERDRFAAAGVRAMAAVPLVVGDKAVGLLGLAAAEAGFFDAELTNVLSELAANISFALELMAKQDEITWLAHYDPLTALPNRTLFHERLDQALDTARRTERPLAVLVFDIERFKSINDAMGQHIGDAVLRAVGERLRQSTGDLHRVARITGDRFAVMFPAIGGAAEVARRTENGAGAFFREPFALEGQQLRLAAKGGIAIHPEDGGDAETLFRNAEAALKRAKETGERYLFYAPQINARVSEQLLLENRLRQAVDSGELFLHLQPKYDLASGALAGVEGLMRWKGPDGRLVSPAEFIPVLEHTGLIFEAGQQMLAAAKQTYRGWRGRFRDPPRIAINVSALQLRRRTFVEDVRAALGDVGADAGGIDLEITESLLMNDVEASIAKLAELRDAGLNIALDDFGTGYSSLAYLSKLPVDTLKIDRAFVHGMLREARDRSIVSAIISLSRALRLKVVAEGVETENEATVLRELGCTQAQGYFFSRPLPVEKVEELLQPL